MSSRSSEAAVLAVFQPFVTDLVAADPVILNLGRDGAEILGLHALGVRVVAKALQQCGDAGFSLPLGAVPVGVRAQPIVFAFAGSETPGLMQPSAWPVRC